MREAAAAGWTQPGHSTSWSGARGPGDGLRARGPGDGPRARGPGDGLWARVPAWGGDAVPGAGGRALPRLIVLLPAGLGLGRQLLRPLLRHLHPFLRRPGSHPPPQLHQVPAFRLLPGPHWADGHFDERDPWAACPGTSTHPLRPPGQPGVGEELFPRGRARRAGTERHPRHPRFLESHWFVWVTQMNHIVMEIDREPYRDWLSSQVGSQGPSSGAGAARRTQGCAGSRGCPCPSAAGHRAERGRLGGSSGGTVGDSAGRGRRAERCDMEGRP